MTGPAPLLRPELAALSPYNAGLTLAEVAARPGVTRVAKLGSNENPAGPAPEVIAAIREAAAGVGVYPDPAGRDLIAGLAAHHGLDPQLFALGNGSEDLLAVLARAVLRPGDEVVTLFPSFPLHEDYALTMGAKLTRIGLTAAGQIDLPALLAAVARPVRLVLFANPMNPAGVWLDAAALRQVLAAVHPTAITCLDEAYHEYASVTSGGQDEGPDYASAEPLLASHPGPLVILRTFSKAWGLAGLRIGYAMTNNAGLKRGFDLARTPFNTNILAQVAARVALVHPEAVVQAVALATRERERLADALNSLGLRVLPSRGNFLFVDCGRPAGPVAEALLDHGVIVKPWKQPGFGTWLRVSTGSSPDGDQFLAALARVLA
ncbi:aminotransferase class I/II-fold pyridoxal phosphate-dependent enzyme [Pseudogemmobacter bohemicus]|uniref:aminotransferase class I/II-fold pyridoxal phosphate-dependent enzyme n=1 Tax=Pseudogemmobacter bohemicus TaxID=2250708 RepID=UPI000DD323F3|nr:aminotransferase class I/II-fold pyridoxal phosphate-dependent enzyme [Pseudogemmobacter bohemicus]